MRWMAVDTSAETGSVALAHGESSGQIKMLGSVDLPARTFSVRLIPAISELLQSNHIALAELDGFAVVRGPGSFTGLRVGLSAVKGLAEATGKPVIALSRLAVMASMQPQAPLVHGVLDAGRGEFYSGVYRDAGWECVRESLETADSLRAALQHSVQCGGCIVAEGSVADAHEGWGQIARVHSTAADVFPLLRRCWQQQGFADVATLDANYLRRSDAELFARPQTPAASAASL